MAAVELEWDVFISHASEDKEAVARPLAERLRNAGLRVWLDEEALAVGDSLTKSIARGLAACDYAVIVVSPRFFAKEWTQIEFDALVARETSGKKMLLPVLYGLEPSDVKQYSTLLADRLWVSMNRGIDTVVKALVDAIERDRWLVNAIAKLGASRRRVRRLEWSVGLAAFVAIAGGIGASQLDVPRAGWVTIAAVLVLSALAKEANDRQALLQAKISALEKTRVDLQQGTIEEMEARKYLSHVLAARKRAEIGRSA